MVTLIVACGWSISAGHSFRLVVTHNEQSISSGEPLLRMDTSTGMNYDRNARTENLFPNANERITGIPPKNSYLSTWLGSGSGWHSLCDLWGGLLFAQVYCLTCIPFFHVPTDLFNGRNSLVLL